MNTFLAMFRYFDNIINCEDFEIMSSFSALWNREPRPQVSAEIWNLKLHCCQANLNLSIFHWIIFKLWQNQRALGKNLRNLRFFKRLHLNREAHQNLSWTMQR
jgi:hypothetical protein